MYICSVVSRAGKLLFEVDGENEGKLEKRAARFAGEVSKARPRPRNEPLTLTINNFVVRYIYYLILN